MADGELAVLDYKALGEFVRNCISSVVAMRGLYAPEFTIPAAWNNIEMSECIHPQAQEYLSKSLRIFKSYIAAQRWTQITLVIHGPAPNFSPVECWRFDINKSTTQQNQCPLSDLEAIYLQIVSSGGFLPSLDTKHTFRVLVSAQANVSDIVGCYSTSSPRIGNETKLRNVKAGGVELGIVVEAQDA